MICPRCHKSTVATGHGLLLNETCCWRCVGIDELADEITRLTTENDEMKRVSVVVENKTLIEDNIKLEAENKRLTTELKMIRSEGMKAAEGRVAEIVRLNTENDLLRNEGNNKALTEAWIAANKTANDLITENDDLKKKLEFKKGHQVPGTPVPDDAWKRKWDHEFPFPFMGWKMGTVMDVHNKTVDENERLAIILEQHFICQKCTYEYQNARFLANHECRPPKDAEMVSITQRSIGRESLAHDDEKEPISDDKALEAQRQADEEDKYYSSPEEKSDE